MKLKRVVNSSQKVTSATAPNNKSAIANHSQVKRKVRCQPAKRHLLGKSASYRQMGATSTLATARSNHRPLAKISGHSVGGIASAPTVWVVYSVKPRRVSVEMSRITAPAISGKRGMAGRERVDIGLYI